MKTKLFTLLLAILTSMTMANAEIHSGTCGAQGDNLTWELDTESGLLTISGTGAMADYDSSSDVPWDSINTLIHSVIINNGVTSIGDRAFHACYYLREIAIPSSLVRLGKFSLSYCGFVSIELPNSITTIDDYAFDGCQSLTAIVIPRSVTKIGKTVFGACYRLASITVAKENPVYDSRDNCNAIIETATNTLTTGCFKSIIPTSVRSIEDYAFAHCSSQLRSMTIPNNVQQIGECAFWNCSLNSITIGSGLQQIGQRSFGMCKYLNKVIFKGTIPPSIYNRYDSQHLGCFEGTTCDFYVPCDTKEAFIAALNEGVRASDIIDSSRVHEQLGIAYTVVSSDDYSGYVTFQQYPTCEAPTLVVRADAEDGWQFKQWSDGNTDNPRTLTLTQDTVLTAEFELAKCLLASGTCGATAADSIVWELSCDSVLTISGIGAMEDAYSYPWTDYKSQIQSVVIEENITTLGKYAFDGCANLQEVSLPLSLTKIGGNAFYNCASLASIIIPDNIVQIGGRAFWGCNTLTTAVIGNGITSIPEAMFYQCVSLESISIPDNVTSIDVCAFYGCSSLSSVAMGAGISYIGRQAFLYCSSLTTISVDENNPTYCTIDDVLFSKDATQLIIYPFGKQISSYTLPASVTNVEYAAFYNCHTLTNIIIPSGVTYLEQWAFGLCSNLSSITCDALIPPSMGTDVFFQVNKSIPLYVPYESIDLYKAADQWKEFEIILPICETIETEETRYLCYGTSWEWNGDRYTSEGYYTKTLHTIHGCDSIVTLHLIELPELKSDTTVTIPKGSSFIWHGVSYTVEDSPVTYAYQSINTPDCDSIVTLHIVETEDPAPCLLGTGTCGENLTWELSCDSVLTISGTGAMTNYQTLSPAPWWYKRYAIKTVIVNEGVTTLGTNAFSDCKFTSVSLPNTLTSIPLSSFSNCKELISIVIPESVISIGAYAFTGCNSLTTITIPKGVTDIDWQCALSGSNMIAIYVAEDNPNYRSIDGALYSKDSTALIQYPYGKHGDCVLPDRLERIGYLALSSELITSITCGALVPPALDKGAIDYVNKSIPLYVHYASIDTYKSANGWKEFTNIQPIEGFPVVFLNYSGEVLSEQYVKYGMSAIAPNVPDREGYTFVGWSADIEHIVAKTYVIAMYEKIGGTLTYLSEEGDVIATENVDLHLPAAPIIAGKSFKGWLTESADAENGIVLRATYTSDNPTTHDDVTITPSSNSAYVIFPFITGALTYQLVIRDLFGNVVCKIMFSATGHLLGIAFAPSRNRESQQATQTTGFNFTVEGLDANTTYEYEFVANDDTDEVIETLSGSFTTTVEVPTDNEQVNSPSAVRKYLDDGHLMIDANSHIFNTQGKMIK